MPTQEADSSILETFGLFPEDRVEALSKQDESITAIKYTKTKLSLSYNHKVYENQTKRIAHMISSQIYPSKLATN